MFKTIREHLERNRAELEDIKLYFQKCADEIDRTNLYMLRKACMWTSIVFIGMLFLSKILILVVEVNEKTCTGEMVIKYAKTREKFAGIPILAVASNEEGESRAKELGADVVLITSQPGEVFKDTIGELTKTK
ncbi:MAG: hypothetical protein IJU77_08350 [Butyrivibrio sp.]|nr:hypothetical protein [Butyrivibrio sp.]